jgi:S-adenosylmethionine:tRNA ribosyltransferase-isomerase
MNSDELDFELPPELIAQTPAPKRCASHLLHYRRGDRSIRHSRFSDVPGLLERGDVLVFNDAKVIPARFGLRKSSGGRIDGLFLAQERPGRWRVLLRNLGSAPVGTTLAFEADPAVTARIAWRGGEGEFLLDISADVPALELLERLGRMPLPPYIKRGKRTDRRDALDRERYQTVYAAVPGAVAAPTAGLHFTPQLLAELDEAGIERVTITLDVGLGTFKPITTATLEAHVMHAEAYSIGADAAAALNRAKTDNRRIIAVGTTSARVLESQPEDAPFAQKRGETDLFIYPPYRWKHVEGLITNFHLPRSTLIALVAAMTGLDEQRRIYGEAIEQKYRFFSYGDAMLIE